MASNDQNFDARFDPAFQRGFEGALVEPASASQPSDRENAKGAASKTERADDTAPTLRANPWVIALWIVAAVFTVAGIAGQTIAELITAAPTADSPLVEYVIPALLSALSPWLLVAGLFAGIGVMFLHAVRWRG